MANIILKNRSNQEQTYEGVEVVQLNTDTGETAAFVSRELIPEPYVHPKTHPASMIEGLKKAATSGDYRDLRNKPCYPMPSLAKTVLTFAYDEEMQDHHATIEGSFQLDKGDAYTVSWDGTDYFCTVKDPADSGLELGFRYLGNLQRFWNSNLGEDTGEPFILMVSDDECTTLAAETNVAGPHTVGITPAKAVHPLDAEYLPESAATKSWVQSQISAGGGGSGDIPERVIFNGEITTEQNGIVYLLDEASLPLISWLMGGGAERYTVIFDGETYTPLTPVTYAEEAVTFIGNEALTGEGEDTGEPFVIGAYMEMGFPISVMQPREAGTHTLTVSVPITAENNYVPTFDFTGWGSVAFGGKLEGEDLPLELMGEFALLWMLHSRQIQVKFLCQVSDTETTPMTMRISDIHITGEDMASAIVWSEFVNVGLGVFRFAASLTEGITLQIAKVT